MFATPIVPSRSRFSKPVPNCSFSKGRIEDGVIGMGGNPRRPAKEAVRTHLQTFTYPLMERVSRHSLISPILRYLVFSALPGESWLD